MSPFHDWIIFGDLFIENVELYSGIDLPIKPKCKFSTCPFGGPLAIAVQDANAAWEITICSSNGNRHGIIKSSNIFFMFWSKCQKLVLLNPNGQVLLYNAKGIRIQNPFYMNKKNIHELDIVDAKFFSHGKDTGLAVLNEARMIFGINSINNSQALWEIRNPERIYESPSCWAVLSSVHKATSVILCFKTKIYVGVIESVPQYLAFDWLKKDGTYLNIEANFDQSMIAFVHDTRLVQIVSKDLDSVLHTINSFNSNLIPKPLWFSNFALVFQNENPLPTIQFYGFNNENYTFNYSSSPLCISEDLGGIRIFTKNLVYFLTPVCRNQKNLFGPVTSEPAAMLYEAYCKLELNDQKFYDYIKCIMAEDKMSTAVNECLQAAANCFDTNLQKTLLKATSMGIKLCERYNTDGFVDIVRKLRVLNVSQQHGFPITYEQLKELTILGLINRYTNLNNWLMAIKICEHMEVSQEDGLYKILAHWCLFVMNRCKSKLDRISEERAAEKILLQIKNYPGISYADIADEAAKNDLQKLASLLLDQEPNLSRQVTVLLRLKKVDKALAKAAQSQQPDLLHQVIRHLKKNTDARDVELLIRKIPQALSIYQSYVHEEAPDRALILYEQGDDFPRQAIYYLHKAKHSDNNFGPTNVLENLNKAEKCFHSLKDTHAQHLIHESIKLINDNLKREDTFNTVLTDKTVRETFIWAIQNSDDPIADLLKRQNKLNDKQLFLWTIEGLAKSAKWQQLETFGRSRKSPVGYLPLIETCCRYKNLDLAKRFMVDKVISYEEQLQANILMGDLLKAAKLAAEKSDTYNLQNILRKCVIGTEQRDQISKIIQTINSS